MSLFSRFQRLLRGRTYRFIVIGADWVAYQVQQQLPARLRGSEVLFVIDDEPWNHRTRMGSAELRYPAELPALVERHRIDGVLCADRQYLDIVPATIRQRLMNSGSLVLVKDDDTPLEAWLDSLPARLAAQTESESP